MGSYLDKLKNQGHLDVIEKHFFQHGDALPVEKLLAFQDEAVKELVAHTYANSPFYRAKMDQAGVRPEEVRSVADLSKLPFTDKDELRGDPWILLACDKKDVSVINVSTGTTGGEMIYIFYTWKDFYLNDLAVGYPRLVPIEPGDICINALPYEMSSAGLAFHKVFMDACGATAVPVGKGGAYSTPEKTVRIMRDLKPTIVMTTPSWAVRLAEAAGEAGFDLKELPLKRMWITGEGCSPAFRDRLEKIWGTTANFYYGSLECGALGMECDQHFGYHIPLAHVVVEIVDPKTGEVLEPGEIGEIVATCLLRYSSPLIRYRTQDLGYVEYDQCPCGVALPRLFLRGRQVDQVVLQGYEFSPFYLEEFLMRLPEVGMWYQFVVPPEGADRLKIRVELQPGVEPTPELADRLASKMEFGLGIPCEFEFVDRLPRPVTKTIRVVHE
ncbi:MAG: AMP-binding protein [Bacillota bacterium]|nr:AMP-binding protein [Bacillota bacterium]